MFYAPWKDNRSSSNILLQVAKRIFRSLNSEPNTSKMHQADQYTKNKISARSHKTNWRAMWRDHGPGLEHEWMNEWIN